jgi:hypothetical protein
MLTAVEMSTPITRGVIVMTKFWVADSTKVNNKGGKDESNRYRNNVLVKLL